jgi:DNA-binding NarL/FixJ family response regulator
VVIVDADRRVMQSLADLLGVTGEIAIVGGAGDVRSALELVEEARPDVALIDPRLPDIEAGVALIAGLTRAWPSMRIVMTGWSDTEGHIQPGGSTTYVSKSASPEEFATAIVDACCAA